MKKPEINKANLGMLKDFYGGQWPIPTGKFWAICIEDETIAVGGYVFQSGECVLFADLTETAKRFPVHVVRLGKRIVRDFEKSGYRKLTVIQDETEITSARWLSSLGFTQQDHSTRWVKEA